MFKRKTAAKEESGEDGARRLGLGRKTAGVSPAGGRLIRRALAALLCLCLVLPAASPIAEAAAEYAGGLCPHHPVHTWSCGFREGGSPCAFHCPVCSLPDSGVIDSGEASKIILDWEWVDPEGYLSFDEEERYWWIGIATDEDNPCTEDLALEVLPKAIRARMMDGSEREIAVDWDLSTLLGGTVYYGDYTVVAYPLSIDYVLYPTTAWTPFAVIKLTSPSLLAVNESDLAGQTVNGMNPLNTTVNLFDYWVRWYGYRPTERPGVTDASLAAGGVNTGDLLTKKERHWRDGRSPWGKSSRFSTQHDWYWWKNGGMGDLNTAGINYQHLLMFGDGVIHAGLWNKGAGEATIYGKTYAGMEGIVEPVLKNGYPVLNLADAKKQLQGITDVDDPYYRDVDKIDDWKLAGECTGIYEQRDDGNNLEYNGTDIQNLSNTLIGLWEKETGKSIANDIESLDYLFDPSIVMDKKNNYINVQNLFQIDNEGYYYYNMRENFAELVEEDILDDEGNVVSNGRFKLYKKPATKRTDGAESYGNFFPFNKGTEVFNLDVDGTLKGDVACSGNTMNHHFGMTVETSFRQPIDGMLAAGDSKQPMTFQFSGDDDVWVFIDNVLVLDLGGVHSDIYGIIDFSNGKVFVGQGFEEHGIPNYETGTKPNHCVTETTIYDMFQAAGMENTTSWKGNTFASNSSHTLKMFYLERGNYDSSLAIRFNLQPEVYHQVKKVDQAGNALEGVEFKLYPAEKVTDPAGAIACTVGVDEDTPYYVRQKAGTDALATLKTDADGTARFVEEEPSAAGGGGAATLDQPRTRPFNFADKYNEATKEGQYYILRETREPDGFRPLPTDIVLRYDPGTTMLVVGNRWTTGAYASFTSTIQGTANVHYGQIKEDGTVEADGNAVAAADQSGGLVVAIPSMKRTEDGTWLALSGSNLGGFTAHALPSLEAAGGDDKRDALRKAMLAAVLTQAAGHVNDRTNVPAWHLDWNASENRLEGFIQDFPGRPDQYQLLNPDKGTYRINYGIIMPEALTALGIDHAAANTFEERYKALGREVNDRAAAVYNGDVEAAVEAMADEILDIHGTGAPNDRGFSFVNVNEFVRNFRSLIYIPNEQRELRVQKVDQNGRAVDGSEFAIYENREDAEAFRNPVATGVTASVGGGQKGVLIFKPRLGAEETETGVPDTADQEGGAPKPGYARIRWANLQTDTDTPVEYFLREVRSPAGYRRNETVIPIVVARYSIYADAGDEKDGVTVMAGAGTLAQTMKKYASEGDVDITLRDITVTGQGQNSGNFSMDGWRDMALRTPEGAGSVTPGMDLKRSMNLHYKLNAVVDYGLHDQDGGRNFYPFFVTDTGYARARVSQNYRALTENSPYGDAAGVSNSANKENLGDTDITSLFSLLNIVVVTNRRDTTEKTGQLTVSKEIMGSKVAGEDLTRNFDFLVELTDEAGTPLPGSYYFYGTDKSGYIHPSTVNGDGTTGQKLVLHHDESITILGLPEGTRYKVTETVAEDKFPHTAPPAQTVGGKKVAVAEGYIQDGITAHADFINSTDQTFGQLTIRKLVTGLGGSDQDNFTFNLTFTDAAGRELATPFPYQVGSVTANEKEEGAAREGTVTSGSKIRLRHGEKITVYGIPAGTKYQVSETSVPGYTTTRSGDSGTITETPSVADFTNHKAVAGTLRIKKRVTGVYGERDRKFRFKVELVGPDHQPLKDVPYLIDTTERGRTDTFRMSSGDVIELQAGDEAIFNSLPENTVYTVTELDANKDGYTTTTSTVKSQVGTNPGDPVDVNDRTNPLTGTVHDKDDIKLFFVNHRGDPEKGRLSLQKTVSGPGADANRPFTFTVRLTKDGGDSTADYSLPDGTTGQLTGTGTFTLRHGQRVMFWNIPAGTGYTVTETPAPGYKAAQVENASGTVERAGEEGKITAVQFTNIRVGGLHIKKRVTGVLADRTQPFHFAVELTKDGRPLPGDFPCTVTETDAAGQITGTHDRIVSDGSVITLKAGWEAVIRDLPAGTGYRVTEEEAGTDGYVTLGRISDLDADDNAPSGLSPADSLEGTLPESKDIKLLFINHRGNNLLDIRKQVSGTGAETDRSFTFTLTLTDAAGSPVHARYSTPGGAEHEMTGTLTFALKHSENLLVWDIPTGSRYAVTEARVNGYTASCTNPGGEIGEDGQVVEVNFVNTRTVPRDPDPGDDDDPDPDPKPGPDPRTPPDTGDFSKTSLWVVLALGFLAAFWGINRYRRRRAEKTPAAPGEPQPPADTDPNPKPGE